MAICLYDNAGSVAAQKVRILLAEKGLTFKKIPIDLRNGEVMSPEYLRLNPDGVVPTLRHNGAVLVESSLINEYLEEVFPTPPLRPIDPVDRHRMRLWVKLIDDQAHRAIGSLSQAIYIRHAHLKKSKAELEHHFARMPDRERAARQRAVIRMGVDAPQVADALHTYSRLIDRLDQALIDRDWLAGPSFSLADIACAPYIARLDMLSLSPLWRAGRRPHLARWWSAVQSRDSYRREIDQAIAAETRAQMAERGEEAWPRLAQIMQFG